MKYNMKKYSAYVAAIGFFIFWLTIIVIENFKGTSFVIFLTVFLCLAEFMFVFVLFRSYIVLEPKRLVIYAGLSKRVVLYENIEYIKESSYLFSTSHIMCYAIPNIGIKIKGFNFFGMNSLLVSVQDLNDFLNEIEATQPDVKIIRKNT